MVLAVSEYKPILSILHPANLSKPETALLGLLVQLSIAPSAEVITKVIELLAPGTVLPLASCTATTGWDDHVFPATPPPG